MVQVEWCESGVFTCGTGRVVCLPVVQVEWCESGACTCGTSRVVHLPVVQAEWCVYLWYR